MAITREQVIPGQRVRVVGLQPVLPLNLKAGTIISYDPIWNEAYIRLDRVVNGVRDYYMQLRFLVLLSPEDEKQMDEQMRREEHADKYL